MICEAGDNRAKRRAMLKRLGLCCNCRKPADGLQFCQGCRDRYNATQRAKTAARREAKLCIDCEQPAASGKARCQKCLDLRKKESGCRPMQTKSRPCECCQVEAAVTNGYLCPGCVRLMAGDALRKKLHSRCEEGGELDLDGEIVKNAEYQAARSLRVGGQRQFGFIGKVPGIAEAKPYETPEYSVGVFTDSLRWEG